MSSLGRKLCAALIVLPLACAGTPPTQERTVLVGNAASVVVLLPLNVTAQLPEEFGAVIPVVRAALQSYLQEHGAQLKTLALPTARRLWLDSVREVRTGEPDAARGAGFARAARVFVGKLAKYSEFDTVVVPSLFIQRASIEGRSAAWDGVEREVEIELPREQRKTPENLELQGAAAAASLHVVVVDREGEIVHEGQGGLELLVRVRFRPSDRPGAQPFEFTSRPNPFDRPENLREGIATALAPFFPYLPRSGTDAGRE